MTSRRSAYETLKRVNRWLAADLKPWLSYSFHSALSLLPEVKVGLIGCGRIGQFHAETLSQSSGAQLSWLSDVREEPAQRCAEAFQTRFLPSHALETAFSAAAGSADYVDAVLVCSPTQFHPYYVDMCLNHRKPVLCEKPLTSDPAQLSALFELSTQKQTPLRIGYQRVFDRDLAELIREVQSYAEQEKVAPWSISMRSYDSPTAPAEYLRVCGSAFMDAMCHDFHVAASLLAPGDHITSAQATEAPFKDSTMGARTAAAVFKSSQGTLITAEFHRVSQIGYDNSIDVAFPSKMYRLQSRPRFAIAQGDGRGCLIGADYDTGFLTKYGEAYRAEIAAFLQDVQHGAPPDVAHMQTCLSAMKMVRLAIDAAAAGREIHSTHKQ